MTGRGSQRSLPAAKRLLSERRELLYGMKWRQACVLMSGHDLAGFLV